MSTPLDGFLWLLSDEEESSDAAHQPVLPAKDQTYLRLVRDDEVTERWESTEQPEAPRRRGMLSRMQDLFDTDGSGRYEEDADVWRRMAVAVILAIAVGIVCALGAAVLFSRL